MVQGKYEFIYLILNIYSFKFEEHTKIWLNLLAVIQLDGTQGKEPLHMGWPLDKFSVLSFTTFLHSLNDHAYHREERLYVSRFGLAIFIAKF